MENSLWRTPYGELPIRRVAHGCRAAVLREQVSERIRRQELYGFDVLTSREDEAAMRVVLLVLAITNVILAFAAVGLFEWWRAPQFIGDTNVYLGQLAAALGFLVALATAIVGSMAMAQRRQMGWLGGLIVAWLISAVGSYVAIVVIQPWQYYVVWDRCPP
jgi:hypothetical protein